MALKDPKAGLRRLRYDSVSVAKVQINVAPGDVLDVPETIAAQLVATDSHFKPDDAPDVAEPVEEAKPTRRRKPSR